MPSDARRGSVAYTHPHPHHAPLHKSSEKENSLAVVWALSQKVMPICQAIS